MGNAKGTKSGNLIIGGKSSYGHDGAEQGGKKER